MRDNIKNFKDVLDIDRTCQELDEMIETISSVNASKQTHYHDLDDYTKVSYGFVHKKLKEDTELLLKSLKVLRCLITTLLLMLDSKLILLI
jgi:hypothetical protein